MALTEVRHTLLDARRLPRTQVDVTARLIAPAGYLTGGTSEIIASTTAETNDAGLVSLFLTPQSEVEYVGSVYEVTWQGLKTPKYISVPNTGPAQLRTILATPPDLGGVTPGGRGVASTAVVGGNLIVTYTDGSTQNAGAVNPGTPGTPGADGAAGPAGTGLTTVTGVTTRISKVLAYLSGGSTLFKRAKTTYNVVDDYDADPTGVADSSTAFLNCLTDANAVVGGALVVVPGGKYKITTATRLFVGLGTSVRGDNAEMTFENAAGGWSVGNLTVNAFNGFFEGLWLKGNATARNPLYIGWVIGRDFRNIRITGAGYNAADTLAVRNKSAGMVVESAQNCLLTNVLVQSSAHRGMVFDFGCGGLTFIRSQINDIGSAGSADARHITVNQSAPQVAPLPAVYDRPTNIEFYRGYIEGVNDTQTYMVELGDCDSFQLNGVRLSCSSRAVAMNQIYAGPLAVEPVFDGCTHRGNNSSANPVKVVTGIQVAAGAARARVTGAHAYLNMAFGWTVDDQADLVIDTPPKFTSSSSPQADGLGARRIARSYSVRAATVAGLPTPSVDYLGVRGLVAAVATGTYDTVQTCLRRGGVYVWVDETNSGAPVVLTHTAGVAVVVDASLNRQFETTAVGDVQLGATIGNNSGQLTLLTVRPGATARTVSFVTAGTGGFAFTSAVLGPTLAIPANKTAEIGWKYDSTTARNRLLAFTVDS